MILCALAALALAGCGDTRSKGPKEAWVESPQIAVEAVQAKALYYNGAARPWLLQKRADLLSENDRGKESAKGNTFAQAALDPRLFRQLDRQHRFDAVLLAGDPSEFRPLLDHLLEAGDWKLGYLDHASLVFRRDAVEAWKPERLADLRARAANLPPEERARVWARVAAKLVAARQMPAAKSVLAEAEQAGARTPEVWSTQASYRMALGDWKGALASAQKALELDPDCLPALGCKAQSLYATKHFAEAFAVSSRLLGKLPDEPGLLFYHAKIAHEARQVPEEIRALRRLIELAERNGRNASGYRVYLGQAHATDGNAEEALAEFGRALVDPDLPKEQRDFAEECVVKIRERTGKTGR